MKRAAQQSYVLEQKNTNLRRTRDLLLPKLVSGELDVSELEIAGVGALINSDNAVAHEEEYA